ncbi:STE3-domain-containing protein [Microthyrium microscopicum]|uniref:STE3-domain-containing protein n=1 Tax=Microthyrium microscopicum TaxID=703497 RepID=A0A6A6U1U1_9PEZI|nr:STE3-domain-containing protein [Microthyrium microscopicum]
MSLESLFPLYPAAVVIPIFSVSAILLEIPPFIWHVRNRNFAAICMICWFFAIQLTYVINPIIWPRDNTFEWYDGKGLCDLEIRVLLGANVGIPGCITCIVLRLAAILNTQSKNFSKTRVNPRNRKVMEFFLCIGFPIFYIIIYYLVQSDRYDIFAITGCDWQVDRSWPSVVLILIWPLVITTFNAYLACLILIRMYKYRRNFATIMTSASTTKSRFNRLLCISILLIFAVLPLAVASLVYIATQEFHGFSWNDVHYVNWGPRMIPTNGQLAHWDSIIAIISGYILFLAFGLGNDALDMYKQWGRKLGLARIFPSLNATGSSKNTSAMTSAASRARLVTSGMMESKASKEADTPTSPHSTAHRSYRLSSIAFGKDKTPRSSTDHQDSEV